MWPKLEARAPAAVRGLGTPLVCYLAVTLVAPLLNGAGAREGFWGHAIWVMLTCGLVVGGVALGRVLRNTIALAPGHLVRWTALCSKHPMPTLRVSQCEERERG